MSHHRSAIAVLAVAAACGCASVTDYRPNENAVKEMGADKAKTALKETVLKAQQTGLGLISSVEVTDENLKVKSQQSTLGAFYQMQTSQLETEVYFPTVERIDIYDNNWAYVYSNGNRLVLQLLFWTPQDAQRFADLVMSLHAAKK